MKFQHTAQFALSFNVRVINDAGRDVSALIAPVVYFWLRIPGWLYSLVASLFLAITPEPSPEAARRARIVGNGGEGLHRQNRRGQLEAYLAGWRDDLALIGLAAWLLIRDGRLADVAS